jgi:hypothetical protein
VGNLAFTISFIPPVHTQYRPYPFWFKLIEANLEALLTRPLHPGRTSIGPAKQPSRPTEPGCLQTPAWVPKPRCPRPAAQIKAYTGIARRQPVAGPAWVPKPRYPRPPAQITPIQTCSSSALRHAHRLDEWMPQSAVKQLCKTHPNQNMQPQTGTNM